MTTINSMTIMKSVKNKLYSRYRWVCALELRLSYTNHWCKIWHFNDSWIIFNALTSTKWWEISQTTFSCTSPMITLVFVINIFCEFILPIWQIKGVVNFIFFSNKWWFNRPVHIYMVYIYIYICLWSIYTDRYEDYPLSTSTTLVINLASITWPRLCLIGQTSPHPGVAPNIQLDCLRQD